MKKIKKAILITISVLLITTISISIWQKDNIKALINTQKYTTEELEQIQKDQKEAFQQKIKEQIQNPIRDFTKEEIDQVANGEKTSQEILEQIKTEAEITENPQNKDENIQDANNQNINNNINNSATKEEIVNQALGSLYALKADMNGNLRGLMNQAKAEYIALPQEKKGTTAKTSIAQKYISQGASLESVADSRVSEILTTLENNLKQINQETSIVTEMRGAYENEKSSQKSFYLSLIG